MAGHSKWANIKHRKARSDAKKGKLFSQIIKEMHSAVRQGGADAKNNTRLRLVMHKARAANIPNETIERNLAKASGKDRVDVDEIMYEIYGFGGVGIICSGTTENRNRSASEVRGVVGARGGRLAAPNSVLFNFSHKGLLVITLENPNIFDKIFALASQENAEDVVEEEGYCFVAVDPQRLGVFVEVFTENQIPLFSFDTQWMPLMQVSCSEEHMLSNKRLIDTLENLDDIDQVFHNMKDFPS